MAIELPELPYAKDALAPHISAETIDFHYGAHHATYVKNLNNLIRDTEFAEARLEDIIAKADGGLFNNAAQVWNHTFYWNSLSPDGGGEPAGTVKEVLDQTYGSFAKFKEAFTAKGEDPLAASAVLVEKVRELGLQPFVQPEPLPVIDEDEVVLICWMAVDIAQMT